MQVKYPNKRKAKELIRKVAFNIKRFRMKEGLTQEQLAGKTSITIQRCESGKNDMTLTTINILSEDLNVEPYELLK